MWCKNVATWTSFEELSLKECGVPLLLIGWTTNGRKKSDALDSRFPKPVSEATWVPFFFSFFGRRQAKYYLLISRIPEHQKSRCSVVRQGLANQAWLRRLGGWDGLWWMKVGGFSVGSVDLAEQVKTSQDIWISDRPVHYSLLFLSGLRKISWLYWP